MRCREVLKHGFCLDAFPPTVAPLAATSSSTTSLGAAYASWDVEEAQGAIVRVIRALEESGQVVVTRGTDEYVS